MARYEKQTWVNGDRTKPMSAARLNHMETQADRAVETVAEDIADPDSDIRAEINTAFAESALPPLQRNAITGWYHADRYGVSPANTGEANREALQSLLDAIPTSFSVSGPKGGTVFIPEGVHDIAATTDDRGDFGIAVPKGIRIRGNASMGAYESGSQSIGSTLRAVDSDMVLIRLNAQDGELVQNGPILENLNLVGTEDKTTTLIWAWNVNRWQLNTVSFRRADIGIRLDADKTIESGSDCSWWLVTQPVFRNVNTGILGDYGGSGVVIGGDWTQTTIGMDLTEGVAPMRVLGSKFDVPTGGIGIRTKGYRNSFIAVDFELTGTAVGVEVDAEDGVTNPPSGNGNGFIRPTFVGHGSESIGIRIKSAAKNTQIVAPHFTNVATTIDDQASDTMSHTVGRGAFGFSGAGLEIVLGPLSQSATTARVDVQGSGSNYALDLRSKGTQPVYISPGGTTVVTVRSNVVISTQPVKLPAYESTGRPTPATAQEGGMIYDKTLKKPLWSDGSIWRDAAGDAV